MSVLVCGSLFLFLRLALSHFISFSSIGVSSIRSEYGYFTFLYAISSLIFNHCLKLISLLVHVRSITVKYLSLPLGTGDVPSFKFLHIPLTLEILCLNHPISMLSFALQTVQRYKQFSQHYSFSQSPFYKTPLFMHYHFPSHITVVINRRGAGIAQSV